MVFSCLDEDVGSDDLIGGRRFSLMYVFFFLGFFLGLFSWVIFLGFSWIFLGGFSNPSSLQPLAISHQLSSFFLKKFKTIFYRPFFTQTEPAHDWYEISNKGKPTGEVQLRFEFFPAGRLKITCHAGRNLIDKDSMGRQDP